MTTKVHSLFIYPLKSAQGIELKKMVIDPKGPKFDREWMLVNENNQFLSQRTHAKLTLIKTDLTKSHLVLSTPTMDSLQISLERKFNSMIDVKIFTDTTKAEHLNKIYDEWLSQFLNEKVKLVRTPEVLSRMTSGRSGPKTNIRFTDGYPFLLTNTATLDELNLKLPYPIEMNRFRPNIIVENTVADSEDSWTEFKIGNVHFLSVKSCTRCKIIDIDPKTGILSKEVTSVLKKYRTKDGNMIFGKNLSHTQTGEINTGDLLTFIR